MDSKKKEILDFLRNRQKRIEIRAKQTGINLWVLFAAAAVIFWMSIDLISVRILNRTDAISRFVLASQALFHLILFSSASIASRNDLRYYSYGEKSRPFLFLIMAFWSALPTILFIKKNGFEFEVFPNATVCATFGLFSIKSISKIIINDKKIKFPNPYFMPSSRADLIATGILCVSLGFSAFAGYHDYFLVAGYDAALMKSSCLISALFVVCFVSMLKKLEGESISWTYALEADLVLDLVSVEVAARRIEQNSLGIRFSQVMNDFFGEIETKINCLESCISDAKSEFMSVQKVPEEYSLERAARWKMATEPSLSTLSEITSDLKGFVNYLERLKLNSKDSRVSDAIKTNTKRALEYADKTQKMSEELKGMTDKISSK